MMRTPFWTFGPAIAGLLTLAACGNGSGPEDSELGSLRVALSGLPADAMAELTVSGPDGFTELVTATTTLGDLAAGQLHRRRSGRDGGRRCVHEQRDAVVGDGRRRHHRYDLGRLLRRGGASGRASPR